MDLENLTQEEIAKFDEENRQLAQWQIAEEKKWWNRIPRGKPIVRSPEVDKEIAAYYDRPNHPFTGD